MCGVARDRDRHEEVSEPESRFTTVLRLGPKLGARSGNSYDGTVLDSHWQAGIMERRGEEPERRGLRVTVR
eukprot:3635188-Rhodomonas_salina.1